MKKNLKHFYEEKHLQDINGWLRQIRTIKLKGGKLPKVNDYKQWIILDLIPNFNEVELWVSGLENYGSLKEVRTNEAVYAELLDILLKISEDLSKNVQKNIDSYLL